MNVCAIVRERVMRDLGPGSLIAKVSGEKIGAVLKGGRKATAASACNARGAALVS